MKQYILVRTDIKVPIGKIIAHAGHNVLNAWQIGYKKYLANLYAWLDEYNQTKIVVEGGNNENIVNFIKKATRLGFPTSYINDVKVKRPICAVIGPVTETQAEVLGLSKLPLFKND